MNNSPEGSLLQQRAIKSLNLLLEHDCKGSHFIKKQLFNDQYLLDEAILIAKNYYSSYWNQIERPKALKKNRTKEDDKFLQSRKESIQAERKFKHDQMKRWEQKISELQIEKEIANELLNNTTDPEEKIDLTKKAENINSSIIAAQHNVREFEDKLFYLQKQIDDIDNILNS